MSSNKIDFLFKGSHPAFYWAAALLKSKGKSVAILPGIDFHSWEMIPEAVISFLGLSDFKINRDVHPIQILTRKARFGIFNDFEFTKKDFLFCSSIQSDPELMRGLTFYSKGSDYPTVFGSSNEELLKSVHQLNYFEMSSNQLQDHASAHLKRLGVIVLSSNSELPSSDLTIEMDLTRAKVFRKKFEITLPLKKLPTGASNRMLFVEGGSPLIELLFLDETLHLRTFLPEEPLLIEKMLKVIRPYFFDENFDVSMVKIVPENQSHYEWGELKNYVDASHPGTWLISPAVNPELGELSLYVRISDLFRQKFKKQQVFEIADLFEV